MNLLTVDTLDAAREKLAAVWPPVPVGRVLLSEARNLILAEDVYAPRPVPAFLRATVDGYAVRAADTMAAGSGVPALLTLAGEVRMGEAADFSIGSGACAGVPTGGMLPRGADAMVMKEWTERAGDGAVAVLDAVSPGRNTVAPGEDMAAGALLLPAGSRITPAVAGALAAAGFGEVSVFLPLRIGILSTGDELIRPGAALRPGCVYDSNTTALCAMAESCGYFVTETAVLPDDEPALTSAVHALLPRCDVIAVSGGSSQGERDRTEAVFAGIAGGILTHGLALKPGKPTILSYDADSDTVLVGLPGHPAAALTVFSLLLGDAMRRARRQKPPLALYATLSRNLACAAGRQTVIPVRLTERDGAYLAEPLPGSSALTAALALADGYLLSARNQEGFSEGSRVPVFRLWEEG